MVCRKHLLRIWCLNDCLIIQHRLSKSNDDYIDISNNCTYFCFKVSSLIWLSYNRSCTLKSAVHVSNNRSQVEINIDILVI